jgi:trimeric autotransporter adhesin
MNTKLSFLITPLVLACFWPLPTTQAVDPPPDGGYPNFNTAEGSNALFYLIDGADNTAIGNAALFNNTFGDRNTGVGFEALLSNTEGTDNTAVGSEALHSNITGFSNTAIGRDALHSNKTGAANTATGHHALFGNTTGAANTATGRDALHSNMSGNDNTATGVEALNSNIEGSNNTANGFQALSRNLTGSNDTAAGYQALFNNRTGDNNTANGPNALITNTDGNDNTATGLNALFNNTTGNDNTANGPNALQSNTTGNDNTAVGHDALFNSTGSENIALGHGAGQNLTTGDNNIDIGNAGAAGEANTIRIGHLGFLVEPGVAVGGHTKTFIAGINGAAVAGGAVHVNAAGQLGTAPSSQRFKEAIKPMDEASQVIYGLKPVAFHYKKELDPDRTQQFGLVAEDVEKVNPDLVARDADGKPYTVRYEAINAMLLNEFLKEHRKLKEQERTITELKSGMNALVAKVKTQASQIQRVSAQLEVSKHGTQMVLNNQ